MSRESLIQLLQTSVPGKIPTTEQLELGELAVNTYDGRIYLKQVQDTFEKIVEFVGSVPIKNTIFVQKNGDDANAGNSWDSAVLTFERALEIADLRNNEVTLIDVGPGEYFTQGHLDLPDNTLIRAAHRSVVIRPEVGFEERNVFRLGSGCFIEGPVFEGWRVDDLENPTEGFAVVFRPGAMISRVPYVHKIVVRSDRYWDTVAPPLDRNNQNPLVGRGGGVVLADGAVLSPYSIFPNIMTWGATPVAHNGIGYCAKNGALINAVNAVSLWAHKHFYAIDGGQIVLSSCSTQFGDFTMVSKGTRNIVFPQENVDTFFLDYTNSQVLNVLSPETSTVTLTQQTSAADNVLGNVEPFVNNLWDSLISNNFVDSGWADVDEEFTRRDAELFLKALSLTLRTADENYMLDFARSLFLLDGSEVFSSDKLAAFQFSFNNLRDQVNAIVNFESQSIVTELVARLNSTIESPVLDVVQINSDSSFASIIQTAKNSLVDQMWQTLEDDSYTTSWTQGDEQSTRRDAAFYIDALAQSLKTSSQEPIENFVRNLFYADKTPVFSLDKLFAFIASFNYIKNDINDISGISSTTQLSIEALTKLTISTIYYPSFSQVTLEIDTADIELINSNKEDIIDNLWDALVANGYTTEWTPNDEEFTRRDANTFIQSLVWVLQTANEKPILDFVKGLFDFNGNLVFSQDKFTAFIFSFNFIRDEILAISNITSVGEQIVLSLVTALTTTLQLPNTRLEPSIITAIGHTWSGIMAGVALTKIPPARNVTNITESILELNQGVVIASGQDDQGSALFVGGLEINADTGELTGPPFDQAVNRIATRAAIARSY